MRKNEIDFGKVKLLLLDVDGVLTDGSFYYSDSGEISRRFHVLDGYGIRLAQQHGLEIAFVSGGKSDSIRKRAEILGIKNLFLGREDKLNVYNEQIKKIFDFNDDEVAFIGDDVYDIPLLEKVGVAVTVPGAHYKVKEKADYITERAGGCGAVRELIDLILGL